MSEILRARTRPRWRASGVKLTNRLMDNRGNLKVSDSQYSSEHVRESNTMRGAEPVVPYTSSHMCGEPVPRVDRFFTVSGPEEDMRVAGRASAERVYPRLDPVGLRRLKIRGPRNVMVHVVLCVVSMLLVAALRRGRPWKARSASSFWW